MNALCGEELDEITVYVYRERSELDPSEIIWRVSDHQPTEMEFDECKATVWVRK